MTGIYKISSTLKPQRFYIGSAIKIEQRWKKHLRELSRGTHHSRRFQNHYNKYGIKDLTFEVLLECEKSELIQIEQFFFDTQECYFNVCRNAGNWSGNRHSLKTKKHLSEINKGIKNPLYGKKYSDEELKKRIESLKRSHNTEEYKARMREIGKKQLPRSEEAMAKMKETFASHRKEYTIECVICKDPFKLILTEKRFLKGKYKHHCSKLCAQKSSARKLIGRTGSLNPMYGKPRSQESIMKWKKSRAGYKHSAMTKIKLSRTVKNKKVCRLKVDQLSLFK